MPTRDTGTEPAAVALARTAMARGVAALSAQDIPAAHRWLERAYRLAPKNPDVALALASTCLATDPARAESLFAGIAADHDVRQAWLGLAAARLRLSGPDAAAEPLAIALSRHAFNPDCIALAEQTCPDGGWCSLRPDGGLEIHANGAVQVKLDGEPIRGATLPVGWPTGRVIEVQCAGEHLLGSPIQIGAVRRLAGCVEVIEGGMRGWAWHPGDPDTAPVLTLIYADGSRQTIVPSDVSVPVPDTGPLARPRSFHLTRATLREVVGPIRVVGVDGKHLVGSPLDPFAADSAKVAEALRLGRAYPAAGDEAAVMPVLRVGVPARPVGADGKRRAVTVVIPMHDGGRVVLACLASVLASTPADAQIVVVDDGSTEPALLAGLVGRKNASVIRHEQAQGFPASANAGIQAAEGRDVVLLNSDTLVPPGWLERLRDAAYSSADIGTVTPLSNDASILSYPGEAGANPVPDQAETNRLDRLAARANGGRVIDIPVGVGFCLYLRRDCLSATGVFRADIFAQGYGEENDLCLRARQLGWRNVALTGLFVGHAGGTTFGAAAEHLQQRNGRIIEQLHPGYGAMISRFLDADPMADARRRIDLLAWKERAPKWRQAAILITHNEGGGLERRLEHAARTHAEAGRRPIVVRPAEAVGGELAVAVHDGIGDDLRNLIFAMPRELPALLRLLRTAGADRIEVHHLADYPPAIYDLIVQIGVPYEVHIHDYAWFCPRVSLVAAHNRYCGEPDLPDCEACIADNGHFLREDIGVAALRDRSGQFLADAQRVVVPADDTGVRMRRYFPALRPVTVPHEDDVSLRLIRQSAKRRDRPSVCVVGAIGVHKGYEVLLACARDAARRDLDLEFVVVGHTIDDARMMDTGRVFVTGRFKAGEAVDLIAAQHAQLGFVPSVCPETWCLSLGDIWRAGLAAAAFDIGAPAERIRRTGRGIVLPLGLSANAINNALVAVIRSGRHG